MNDYSAKLGDVFPLIRNGASIKQVDGAAGCPITRIETIANREIDRNKFGYANIEDTSKYQDYLLQDGDILMSHINSEKHLGKVALYQAVPGEKIIHGMNLLMLRADKSVIGGSYALYYFNSDAFLRQIPRITKKSVNQASFTVTALKELTIPVPELSAQEEMSENLDKVSNLISLRKQQLTKLDELVKARFVELFGDVASNPNGYPIKDFDEISILITDGEHATPRRTMEGIYLLSARNVLNHALQLEDVDYIDEEEYGRIARRIVPQAGDVLISCSGSIGRCCVVPQGLKFQMVRSAALIRFNKTINPVFAEWLITSDDLQIQIAQSATQSSQANLFQGKIKKLHGFVPPIELQNQFAAFVEQTDKSKLAIQQSLDKLETLKKTLMQKYFG